MSTENEINTQLFSTRLVGCRTQKGWSQGELAEKVGVSLRSVQNWEGEDRVPRTKVLRKLCEVLGVGIEYLVEGRTSMPQQQPVYYPHMRAEAMREEALRVDDRKARREKVGSMIQENIEDVRRRLVDIEKMMRELRDL